MKVIYKSVLDNKRVCKALYYDTSDLKSYRGYKGYSKKHLRARKGNNSINA